MLESSERMRAVEHHGGRVGAISIGWSWSGEGRNGSMKPGVALSQHSRSLNGIAIGGGIVMVKAGSGALASCKRPGGFSLRFRSEPGSIPILMKLPGAPQRCGTPWVFTVQQ